MDIGIGTFITLANSAWSAYKIFDAAGPSFRELATDTKALRDHLITLEGILKSCRYKLNLELQDRVDSCERRCRRCVEKAHVLLYEYPSLKLKKDRRLWEQFHVALFEDVEALRTSLKDCVSSLSRAEISINTYVSSFRDGIWKSMLILDRFMVSEEQDRIHSIRRMQSERVHQYHHRSPRDSHTHTIPEEDVERTQQSSTGRTPLHEACAAGNTTLVASLLKQSKTPTVRTKGSRGNALHIATWHRHLSVMRLLLSDLDTETDPQRISGKTQMMNRASKSKELLEMQDIDGDTPLHIAVERRNLPAVSLLLTKGATSTINMRNNKRQTPLHGAATHGLADIARLLLEYRAGTGIKDCEGLTAFDLAKKGGHERCLRLLDDMVERAEKKAVRVVELKQRIRRKRGWFG